MLKALSVLWIAMFCATPVFARTLIVEGVVSPAWVERGDKREPLTVGMQLGDKDKIITGARARVMLRMSEGSAVKMGENATLALDNLAEKKNAQGNLLVSASLEVVKGAFRFTTGVLAKSRAERDVSVKISTITAGIRGTDVWGRSTSEDDLVCLLEGRISVRHAGKEFAMTEPLQFFIAPRNAPPKPVSFVPKSQIEEWQEETEISDGQGAMRAGARLRVELLRTPDQSAAWDLANKLKNAGYPAVAETAPGSYGGAGESIVYVGGVASAKDRDALLARIKDVLAGKTGSDGAPKKY